MFTYKSGPIKSLDPSLPLLKIFLNNKKLFFVEMSFNQKYCKTLLEYFIDQSANLNQLLHIFHFLQYILLHYSTNYKKFAEIRTTNKHKA